MFTDTKFMSKEKKAKVLKDWERFVESGFSQSKFTKRLYEHLHLHCSFITHYDQHGFYHTYFDSPEDTLRFIDHFVTGRSCEFGGLSYWLEGEYGDINGAMCEAMRKHETELQETLHQRIKRRDLATAAQILEKYGIELPRIGDKR